MLGAQCIVWTCVSKAVGGPSRRPKGKRDFEERVEPCGGRDGGTHEKGKDKHGWESEHSVWEMISKPASC